MDRQQLFASIVDTSALAGLVGSSCLQSRRSIKIPFEVLDASDVPVDYRIEE